MVECLTSKNVEYGKTFDVENVENVVNVKTSKTSKIWNVENVNMERPNAELLKRRKGETSIKKESPKNYNLAQIIQKNFNTMASAINWT